MLIHKTPTEIVDRFWMLGTGRYPLYLYRGKPRGTLFEGGTGAMGPVLREQLSTLGVGANDVAQAVITHAHPDHVMAVPMIREMFPDVSILASAPAARTLGAEKAISFFGKLDDMLTTSLIQEGMVAEEHRQPPPAFDRFAVNRVIKEGDRIDVDEGVAFEVIETPGHSDCSLSFFEPGRKILIISDATGYFFADEGDWWPNYFFDYAAYVRSIERLAGYHAEILCLSHNAVFVGADEVASYLSRAREATEQYHQRIVAGAKAGQSVREIAEVLGRESHQRTPLLPVDFFQKNCSLLVKQSLKHEGLPVE